MRRWRFAGYREKVGNPQAGKNEANREIAEIEGKVRNPQIKKSEVGMEIAESEG